MVCGRRWARDLRSSARCADYEIRAAFVLEGFILGGVLDLAVSGLRREWGLGYSAGRCDWLGWKVGVLLKMNFTLRRHFQVGGHVNSVVSFDERQEQKGKLNCVAPSGISIHIVITI